MKRGSRPAAAGSSLAVWKRPRAGAGLLGFVALVGAASLGTLGGGSSTAAAVEVVPECAEYQALVARCVGRGAASAVTLGRPASPPRPMPDMPDAPAPKHRALRDICVARLAQLKEVCR
jgi:hypothetical protein